MFSEKLRKQESKNRAALNNLVFLLNDYICSHNIETLKKDKLSHEILSLIKAINNFNAKRFKLFDLAEKINFTEESWTQYEEMFLSSECQIIQKISMGEFNLEVIKNTKENINLLTKVLIMQLECLKISKLTSDFNKEIKQSINNEKQKEILNMMGNLIENTELLKEKSKDLQNLNTKKKNIQSNLNSNIMKKPIDKIPIEIEEKLKDPEYKKLYDKHFYEIVSEKFPREAKEMKEMNGMKNKRWNNLERKFFYEILERIERGLV